MSKPLLIMRVWRFGFYYVTVFGAYVALALWLPKYYVDVYDISLVDAGLIKGLRLSLKIEKAEGPDGLREVAQRFVAEVQKVKGDSASQMVRRALGMTT